MTFFTPAEASEALAVVRPLVERLVAANAELESARAALGDVGVLVAGNGGGLDPGGVAALQKRAETAEEDLRGLLEELTRLGVQVKDLRRGLVDFPARGPEGVTVLLCWHLGEDDVGYWHGVEEGFAGRKPLPF
jgi:hypothetical protein